VNDPFTRNVQRLAALNLAAFALLAGATFYWGFARADDLAGRADNVRRIAFDRRIARGRILDRAGRILAVTEAAGTNDASAVPARTYPYPSAAPVVGFQTWRYGAGGSRDVTYGAGGAEAAYDVALRGDLGLGLRQLVASRVLHRSQQGHDIVLTLDADLQEYAAGLLGAREGAIVVIDVPSGAVRAMVSQPTFDPAALDAGTPPDETERPMLNRATQGLYPPGSTWKTVTLAAAIADHKARPDDVVSDGDRTEYFEGFPVRCDNNPAGEVTFDLAHAFGWSCNVTFARLGAAIGERRYRDHARDFGVGEAPPFPFPVAASQLSTDDDIPLPELVSAAFGQGELLVTPLHMALVAAAVADDGALPVPYLLADVPGVRWRSLADARGTWRQAVSGDVAHSVRDMMVVSATDGWARSARRGLDLTLGGKTGTAQVADGAPHAWFIGFAPADAPRLAIAVMVVHGGEGAAVAAPIAGRVLAHALDLEATDAVTP
jgi:penicillin-binding protein A